MNKLEKYVYDYLKKYPSLKIKIRNIYMDILDILPDKKSTFQGDIVLREGHFFGFHDITPFSRDDSLILSNRLLIDLRMPNLKDPLEVGYWNENLTTFKPISRSFAWNYHKGCRLQWLGDNNECVIFNSSFNQKIKSEVFNISSNKLEEYPFGIDSVSSNSKYASSFSYGRLEELMPGYGYKIDDNSYLNNKSPNETGLFIIELKNKQNTLIHTLKSLVNKEPSNSMLNARHFVTHSLFSPNNKKIAFLHRWIHDDVAKRYSRLIISNIDGSDINILDTDEMVSHYAWDENSNIIAYCRKDNIDGHYIFYGDSMAKYKIICNDILNSDGHQHVIPGTKNFVTDTYPNQRRYAKLYIVNHEQNQAKEIACIKSPKKFQTRTLYKHWGCDLHPRVNRAGDKISFDSVHSGSRAFCILKLNELS